MQLLITYLNTEYFIMFLLQFKKLLSKNHNFIKKNFENQSQITVSSDNRPLHVFTSTK